MQKSNSILALFLFLAISSFAQNPLMIYSEVQVTLSKDLSVQNLADAGIAIDHVHKNGANSIEFIVDENELTLLRKAQIPFEILVPDLAAQHLKRLAEMEGSLVNMDCGLDHFDEGDMGGYHTYDQMVTHINLMQSEFPELVQITEIGKSLEDRSVYSVKISDNVASDESNSEGVVYYDALTHAREPTGLETHLYFMWWLLENYGTDNEASYLVDNREMYFVPVVNPDGYVYNQTTNPNGGGYWRKNRRENSDGTSGVDLNRNYGYDWGELWGSSDNPGSQTYHGTAAFSEPESRNVRDLIAQIQPAIAFSCHCYSDVMITPETYEPDFPKFETYYDFTSEFMPREYRAYGSGQELIGYSSAGTTTDYLHSEGIYTWTPEIGHSFWENPIDICDRVQEMFIPMKYISWVSGDYVTFYDIELYNTDQLWRGDQLELGVAIKNKGLRTTTQEVTVFATSPSSKLTPLITTLDMGSLAPQETKYSSFPVLQSLQFKLDGDFAIGEEIPIDISILQDGIISAKKRLLFYAGIREELFSEDCENGTDQWTLSTTPWDTTYIDAYGGNHSMADSRYGNYAPETYTVLTMTDPVDLSFAENPFLEFRAKWSLEEFVDFVELQVSTTGGLEWKNVKGKYTSLVPGTTDEVYTFAQHWVEERIDLQSYVGEPSVQFRFVLQADYGAQSDGFYFDELKIVEYSEGISVSNENVFTRQDLSLSPNPNNGQANLTFNLEEAAKGSITISDLSGKMLSNKAIDFSAGSHKELLSFPENGLYLVEVKIGAARKILRVMSIN